MRSDTSENLEGNTAEDAAGFTLIELMLVVAIIATVAAISIPNLVSARVNANESAAIATLKNVASVQAQCQAAALIDDNNNGAGEFGYFGELTGTKFIRASGSLSTIEVIKPAPLSPGMSYIEGGQLTRAGYTFQIYLPGPGGAFQPEALTGGADPTNWPDATQAEVNWCCYAWPTVYGNTGRRAFFVNQTGDVYFCRNAEARYSQINPPITGTTAYRTAGSPMSGSLALNTTDAAAFPELWSVVN